MSHDGSWLLKDILRRWGGVEGYAADPEGYPAELETWYRPADAPALRVRPIRPDDTTRLREAFARLSPETVYRRFHSVLHRLRDEEVRYLTEVDYRHHLALVAVDEAEDRLVGVARYYLPEAAELAEAAIVVADDWQGRGLGGFLLTRLRDAAEARGVVGFEAWVQPDNQVVRGMLERRGFQVHTELVEGSLRVWFRFEDLFA